MREVSVKTVFTTALCQHGKVKCLDNHLGRLAEHAFALSIPFPGDAVLRELVAPKVDSSDLQLLKITLGIGLAHISTRNLIPPTDAEYAGAPIIITDVRVERDLARFKTGNRHPYDTARNIALNKGAFEALLIDEDGYVVDGSRSSPLLFTGDTLISLEGGIKGITRERVLKKAKELGLRIERQRRKPNELMGLVLIAGSGIGLVPTATAHCERLKRLIQDHQIRKNV